MILAKGSHRITIEALSDASLIQSRFTGGRKSVTGGCMGGEGATGVIDVDEATLEDLKNLDLPVLTRALERISSTSATVAGFTSAT
ncbi:hypothetical protein [Nonomuraea fuscirosea]|uniref:hypothetical protein n=1 Tax=Nonomuraea fuscirosea TaxID=1291556 RepID=UPI003428D213